MADSFPDMALPYCVCSERTVIRVTALEYMEKQLQKHRNNYDCELLRGVPEEMLQNISRKVGYYEAAVAALKEVKSNG